MLSRYDSLTSDLRMRQSPVRERHRDARGVIDALNRYLHASFVFDPVPRTMRAHERVGQRVLLRDGSNLSSVLYALKQGDNEDQTTLQRILDSIRQVPEEPFLDFDFIGQEPEGPRATVGAGRVRWTLTRETRLTHMASVVEGRCGHLHDPGDHSLGSRKIAPVGGFGPVRGHADAMTF